MRKAKKILAVVLLLAVAVLITACSSTSDVVNHNLSKDADEFRIYRRLTVTNARSDTIMLRIEGYMSLSNNSHSELVATIKTGEDTYFKDYVYLNSWTCYVMEQIEPKYEDKYHYEIVFYPSRIIPEIEVKEQGAN